MKTMSHTRWIRAGAFAVALASSAFVINQQSTAQAEAHADDLLNAIGQAFGEPSPPSPAAPVEEGTVAEGPAGEEPVERGPVEGEPVESVESAALEAADATIEASQAEVSSDEQLEAAVGTEQPETLQPAKNLRNSPRQLSVEPGVIPLYPDDTPAWIHAQPDYSSTRHVLPVASLPTADRNGVDDALDEQLLAAMYAYVEDRIVGEAGSGDALRAQITVDYIRRNLIDEPLGYVVELQTSTGPMYQKWVQLVISPEQREQFQVWHEERIQRERLGPVIAAVVVLLGAVGGFHLLVRRPGKQAAVASGAQNDRFELPVVNRVAGKPKQACCKIGFIPIALLVAVPIMIAVAAKRHRSQSSETRYIDSAVEEELLFADEMGAPAPPDSPSPIPGTAAAE